MAFRCHQGQVPRHVKLRHFGHLVLSDVSSLISTHLTPTQSSSQNGFQPMNSPSSACPQGSEYLHTGPGPPPPVCLPPVPTQLPFIPQDSAQSISCRSQSSPPPTGVGLVAFLLWNLATVSDHCGLGCPSGQGALSHSSLFRCLTCQTYLIQC